VSDPVKLVDDDPLAIVDEMVARFQQDAGRTLYPAQIERLLIDQIAYRESLVRAAINDVARQNLVAYARAPMLDYLGELVGVARLPGEDDERLRERIRLAPEHFSVAGPRLAYRFHAMSADASIIDVAVLSPQPGDVILYPLTTSGLPSELIKGKVLLAAAADDARPLCDSVAVADPVDTAYEVSASINVFAWADAETTRTAALEAVRTFCATKAATLGNDITRSALIAALHVSGVHSVVLRSPAADILVPENFWTHATRIDVAIAGVIDD
jgi:phage-related baseplate assembly protein